MSDSLDHRLIKELYETYRDMMLKIALGILHNRADAEDVVQDTFLRIMKQPEALSKIPQKEKSFYLASVIENASINILKKRNRHPSDDIDDFFETASNYSVEKITDEKLLLDEVKSALNALSFRDYAIIYLYYFEQMTPAEIAKALDISEKNIYKYIDRAKKRLRKILNKRGIYYDL